MEKAKKSKRVIEVDTRKILSLFIAGAMCVLALLACAAFLKRFLRVTDFTVDGDSPYTVHDLRVASGLSEGDKLYLLDADAAERRLREKCAYLEKVSVERVFPNKIRFRVDCYRAIWYIEISGDYFALDKDLRVLEQTKDGERFVKAKIPKLILPHIKICLVGSKLVFGENEFERNSTLEFLDKLSSTPFMFRVTEADILHRFNLNIKVDGTYDIYMGNTDNVKEKFDIIQRLIDQALPKDSIGAEINVSDISMFTVKPLKGYADETE